MKPKLPAWVLADFGAWEENEAYAARKKQKVKPDGPTQETVRHGALENGEVLPRGDEGE